MSGKDHVAAAINLTMPERIKWAIQAGENSATGASVEELIQHLANRDHRQATLAITVLFELVNQANVHPVQSNE